MALEITEPIKTVNGILTQAIAARTQLLYKVQRKDDTGTEGTANENFSITVFTTTIYSIGQIIYWGSDDELGNPSGLYQIDTLQAGTIIRTTSAKVGANGSTGYVNNQTTRQGYRIELQLFDKDEALIFQNIFSYVPNQAGFVTIDVGALMVFNMSSPSSFTFSKEYHLKMTEDWNDQVEPDTWPFDSVSDFGGGESTFSGVSPSGFAIGEEFTTDSVLYPNVYTVTDDQGSSVRAVVAFNGTASGTLTTGGENVSITTLLQAVLARKQLLKQGGANMWEYLLHEDSREPKPFTGSTEASGIVIIALNNSDGYTVGDEIQITSDDGTYTNARGTIFNLDIATLMVTTVPWVANTAGGVVNPFPDPARFLTRFTNPKQWRNWKRTVSVLIDQEIVNRTGSTPDYRLTQRGANINKEDEGDSTSIFNDTTPAKIDVISLVIPEVATAFYNKIRTTNSDGSQPLGEDLFYQLEEECPQAIMLDWINSKGGVDQYMFNIEQEVIYTVGEGILSERVIDDDIEFITRTKQRFSGSKFQRITCQAEHLTLDQLQALHEIKQTESLRVYLSKDGENFIDAVVVETLSTPFNTKNLNHKFNVTLEFPDDFDFYEGKLY